MLRRDLLSFFTSASLLQPLSVRARYRLGRDVHRGLGSPRPGSTRQQALISRIADLVVPRTDTPGALDVRVPEFIDAMMTGWYSSQERHALEQGLGEIDRRAGGSGFVALAERDQIKLLTALDGAKGADGSAEAAFATVKELTVYSYFTSERVQKEVLKTAIIPGRFDGCAAFGH